MSDDILKELAGIAVAKKPTKAAKSVKTPVDAFVKTALFQIEKASALRDGKSSFESGEKSYDTSEARNDWFKFDGNAKKYWVQFGFHPVPVTNDKEPLVYMLADDLDKVVDILGKGVTLAQTNDQFKQRIIATAEGAKRKKSPVQSETPKRRTRGPNKAKAA